MFIGNFPDAELTSVFRYKPITKWTFAEVQEAIDERQRELRTKNAASFTRKNHTFQVATAAISQAEIVQGDSTSVNASEPEAITETTHAATNDTGALEWVLNMLERVLERTSPQVAPPFRPHSSCWSCPSLCRVCGKKAHSTWSHCMSEKRCLNCFEVSHQHRNCPRIVTEAGSSSQKQGNWSTQHQGGGSVGDDIQTLQDEDASSIYKSARKSKTNNNMVVFQNLTKLARADSLFYTDVLVNDKFPLQALLDSGSMACTINEEAEHY